jgi:hypothetical protein
MLGIASYSLRNGLTNAHDCELDLKQLISAHLLETREGREDGKDDTASRMYVALIFVDNGLTYVNSQIQDQSCTENFHSHFYITDEWSTNAGRNYHLNV